MDLLNPNEEEHYLLNPQLLEQQCDALKKGDWVGMDEVQKVTKILDLVHKVNEKKRIQFALSGSSSRKLKRGGANLLAGRAFVFPLFPLSPLELMDDFDLSHALNWGTLPPIYELNTDQGEI